MAKSFKDYRKGKSPCSEAGGYGGMGKDAGEPAYKIHTPTSRVVLDLERRSAHDLPVAQNQATILAHPLDGGNEEVFFLF